MEKPIELPTLYLDQQGINETIGKIPGERIQRWFIFLEFMEGESFYSAERTPYTPRDESPYAAVTVVLPVLMIGSQDEIREDTREAIERHAEKHLG